MTQQKPAPLPRIKAVRITTGEIQEIAVEAGDHRSFVYFLDNLRKDGQPKEGRSYDGWFKETNYAYHIFWPYDANREVKANIIGSKYQPWSGNWPRPRSTC